MAAEEIKSEDRKILPGVIKETAFSAMKGKKRHGDRKDGKLLRDVDPMHYFMPILYPNRCDNEAFIMEKIDMTSLNEYLQRKNSSKDGEARVSPFMVVLVAMLKTIALRPKMNRFIVIGRTYQRNELSASFVIKKSFRDDGEEALAYIRTEENDTLDSIIEKVNQQIATCRSKDYVDPSSQEMEIINKLPRFISRAIAKGACFLDRHGKVPQSMIDSDPYYSSVVMTNLGSIKLHAGYHHLTNWGTNSVFLAVGEKKLRPFYNRSGEMELRDSLDLGLTIDERIGDGYYYSKTVRLLKKLLENPELLEKPLSEQVIY